MTDIFFQASYWSNKRHEVQGTIRSHTGEVEYYLFGKWTESLYCKTAADQKNTNKCIWRAGMGTEHIPNMINLAVNFRPSFSLLFHEAEGLMALAKTSCSAWFVAMKRANDHILVQRYYDEPARLDREP